MNKLFVFLLVAASLFVSFGFGSKAVADKKRGLIFTPTPPVSVEIEKIELDKDEILIQCPPPKNYSKSLNFACPEDNGLVAVKTIVNNPENRALTYLYTISGGRIVGQGARVVWDLKRVRPGNYTITVGIDEGRGIRDKTQTQTITVRECSCPHICLCPTLDVSGGGEVKAGETLGFEANVSGGDTTTYTYNWTVSSGEIIEGQGTPKIKVKTSSDMNGIIKATVEISSEELCDVCPKTAFETGTVVK